MEHRFSVVILAAGASARLGRPKQLLPYLGKTLIEHAARTALASGAHEVIVVVGSEAERVAEKLHGLSVRIVRNRDWQEGLSSSIRAGVGAVSSAADCVVIALGDQPRITPDLLRGLATRHRESGNPIVASSYDGVLGVPCAFGRSQFAALSELSGEQGARELIRRASIPAESVAFSGGNVDIDTPEDYRRLVQEDAPKAPEKPPCDSRDARAPPLERTH
ncbi:MAG: nucleotidyltransferase family protein [Fimbriimonas sp.]|nr:nucleotidyltransferase family protein [Fimbriimonas sp.]